MVYKSQFSYNISRTLKLLVTHVVLTLATLDQMVYKPQSSVTIFIKLKTTSNSCCINLGLTGPDGVQFNLSVNVFITKVLIGDIHYVSYWRRDRHFTWSSEPRKGLAAWSAKRVPSFLPRPSALQSCALATDACSVWDSKQRKSLKYVHRNTPLQHWRVPAAWCSQIKDYTVVLSHPFWPRSYEEKLPEKEGHPPAESTEKIVDLFARANSVRRYFDCLVLTKLTQLGESKCL